MSHYPVVVLTHDPDDDQLAGQLAPYDEDNRVAPYRVYLEPGELHAHHQRHLQAGGTERDLAAFVDAAYADEGLADDIADDVLAAQPLTGYDDTLGWWYLATANPQGYWDWWMVGGRWSGELLLRPDTRLESMHLAGDPPPTPPRVNRLRRRQLDLAGQRAEATAAATRDYDRFERAVAGLDLAPRWDDVRARWAALDPVDAVERHARRHGVDPVAAYRHDRRQYERQRRRDQSPVGLLLEPDRPAATAPVDEVAAFVAGPDNIKFARADYQAHPWVRALHRAQLLPTFDDSHGFWRVGDGGRAAFVADAAAQAGVPYAAVDLEGVWHARGRVGWFGTSTDDKSPAEWAAEYWRLLDAAPPEVVLTVVDCHT